MFRTTARLLAATCLVLGATARGDAQQGPPSPTTPSVNRTQAPPLYPQSPGTQLPPRIEPLGPRHPQPPGPNEPQWRPQGRPIYPPQDPRTCQPPRLVWPDPLRFDPIDPPVIVPYRPLSPGEQLPTPFKVPNGMNASQFPTHLNGGGQWQVQPGPVVPHYRR